MAESDVRVMQKHVNVEELLRFRDGSADASETIAVGRHLAGCDRCAAMAREMFRDEMPATFAAEERPPRPSFWVYAIAAAIVLAAIGTAVLFFIARRGASRPTAPAIARTATAPPAERYDRVEWNALVRDALATGAVAVAAPAAAVSSDVLRGPAAGVDGAMAPSATAVESPRPEFSWPAVPDAKFVVSVVAGDDVVARSGTLDRNRWTPEQPLTRGRAYAWQVRAIRGARVETLPAPPRPNPRFRVIGDDEARDLAAARTRHPNDHLLLGVLAAHHGLRGDARRELAQYSAEHPSPAAARLAAGVANP
jgi:hypothetical protein